MPAIVEAIFALAPRRIMDIGPGSGKYGVLCREYLRGKGLERIDAVEAEPRYIDEFRLRGIYDEVLPIDATALPARILKAYDLVLMLDVIEHMDKAAALTLLGRIPGRIIVSTPQDFFQNPEAEAYPTESHVSHWSIEDFASTRRVERDLSALGGVIVQLGPK